MSKICIIDTEIKRPGYSVRQRRKEKMFVRELLEMRDFDGLLEWAKKTPNFTGTLSSMLFDREELIQWRSIEAFGKMAAWKAEESLEDVREMIRKMLWGMNDESGIVMWHGCAVIGEILANVPSLRPEYAKMLASFLDMGPFQRGSYWAMARVAQFEPHFFNEDSIVLSESLNHSDPYVRAYAILTLKSLGTQIGEEKIKVLQNDEAAFYGYDAECGNFFSSSVGEVAEKPAHVKTNSKLNFYSG